jgi:hypothetical protein
MALTDKDPTMLMCAEEDQLDGFDSLYNGAPACINATAARRGGC